MTETQSPADVIRRAATELQQAAMGHAPGSRMEAFHLATSSWLEFEAECLADGLPDWEPSTAHALKIARAWLGEAS